MQHASCPSTSEASVSAKRSRARPEDEMLDAQRPKKICAIQALLAVSEIEASAALADSAAAESCSLPASADSPASCEDAFSFNVASVCGEEELSPWQLFGELLETSVLRTSCDDNDSELSLLDLVEMTRELYLDFDDAGSLLMSAAEAETADFATTIAPQPSSPGSPGSPGSPAEATEAFSFPSFFSSSPSSESD